ncbi:hypothetical protein BpHYR1_007913 [Brachionus plicatilis]|uniref:Uncharacterized protein n=1 Tax=Brachionus plicatilis TaxID=10195 RepID=A0A3M7QHW9_BRAPC|nr:hypothetical protein BpHYR1_007913 [Brachionus plicatilis]
MMNLNSNSYTRALINDLIEESAGKEYRIGKNSITSELQGIIRHEIEIKSKSLYKKENMEF